MRHSVREGETVRDRVRDTLSTKGAKRRWGTKRNNRGAGLDGESIANSAILGLEDQVMPSSNQDKYHVLPHAHCCMTMFVPKTAVIPRLEQGADSFQTRDSLSGRQRIPRSVAFHPALC